MGKDRVELVDACLNELKNSSPSIGKWKDRGFIGRVRNVDRSFSGESKLIIDRNCIKIIKVLRLLIIIHYTDIFEIFF